MNVNVVNKQNSNSSNKKKSNTSVVFSIFCRKLLKNPFLWKKKTILQQALCFLAISKTENIFHYNSWTLKVMKLVQLRQLASSNKSHFFFQNRK